MEQLTISSIFRNSIAIGSRGALSVMGAVIFWALTLWIPYLNVGTTIGLLGLVASNITVSCVLRNPSCGWDENVGVYILQSD